jgi:Large polyvalent protein associated domain 29
MTTKAAAVAKAIRSELKQAHSDTKFSVRSQAHGAVYVSWTDGPATADIDALTSKYMLGHFDGMTDSYDYNNKRNDLPQIRFVICQRDRSETTDEPVVVIDPCEKLHEQDIVTHYGETTVDLREAFENVENPANWKLPILATIAIREVGKTERAIEFFVGGPTTVKLFEGEGYAVLSNAGYYVNIGA